MNQSKLHLILQLCLVLLVSIGSAAAAGLKISTVANSSPFDPWDQTKWSAWYENGAIARSFIIDQSVTFASPPNGEWKPNLKSDLAQLFEISTNGSYIIDGSGITIDVTNAETNVPLQTYYEKSRKNSSGVYELSSDNWPSTDGILVSQTGNTITAGTFVKNITLRGFDQGMTFNHKHKRLFTIENVTIERCVWGFFPRGTNCIVRNSSFRENFLGAAYLEYQSSNWIIENNIFADNCVNNKIQSFGDLTVDSCQLQDIRNNIFEERNVPESLYTNHQTAISIFRNSGENDDIREVIPNTITITGNSFSKHHIAINVAARMGASDVKDRSKEGRSHSYDIIIENNIFSNCKIGTKLNGNSCDVINNSFNNCEKDVVVHCVFYHSIGNYIAQDPTYGAANAWLWSDEQDFTEYKTYCWYQKDGGNAVHESITDSEKLFHVITDGNVSINQPSRSSFTAQVITAPSLAMGANLNDIYDTGVTPKDIAIANFVDYSPGDEIAVIWNEPNSTLNEDGITTNYYSIVIYDQWGNELDRCGRSTTPWERIAGGNMLEGLGHVHVDDEAEIAAITTNPENGKYPIYIFRRGFAKDDTYINSGHVVKIGESNGAKMIDITVGNFNKDKDDYDEVSIIYDNPDGNGFYRIQYRKPTLPNWSRQTRNIVHKLKAIDGGNFDTNTLIDEIAGIYMGGLGRTTYPVDFFKPGHSSGAYLSNSVAASEPNPWDSIAVGDFDLSNPGPEIAIVSSKKLGGSHRINFYRQNGYFIKQFKNIALGVPALAIDAGSAHVAETLALEETVSGSGYGSNIGQTVESWGDFVGILPSAAQTTSTPALIINVDPSTNSNHYLRNIPLYR